MTSILLFAMFGLSGDLIGIGDVTGDLIGLRQDVDALRSKVDRLESRLAEMSARSPGCRCDVCDCVDCQCEPEVTIYSADWCSYCHEAEAFCKANGISYRVVPETEHSYTSLPVIHANGKTFRGWDGGSNLMRAVRKQGPDKVTVQPTSRFGSFGSGSCSSCR